MKKIKEIIEILKDHLGVSSNLKLAGLVVTTVIGFIIIYIF